MTFPSLIRSSLPPNTIAPDKQELFIQYITRLYEDIAFAVNEKDFNFYAIPVTNTAVDIPNLPNFGAYIVCVSGQDAERDANGLPIGWLPTITASLCKADATAAGSIATLGSQVGTGTWAGNTLIISATATNFQIRHDRVAIPVVTGNFNIRIIGTQ